MLSTSDLFQQIASMGVTLSLVSNDRIKAVPKERLDDLTRQAIRELKPALIKALQKNEIPPPSLPCPLSKQLEPQDLNLSIDPDCQIRGQRLVQVKATMKSIEGLSATPQPEIFGPLVEARPRDTNISEKKMAVSNFLEPTATKFSKAQNIDDYHEMEASFQAGFPWLMAHLDELLTFGWSRRELFRRGRYHWPNGDWGACWLSSWSDPGKTPSIGQEGEILFTFTAQNGEQAQYSAWPLSLLLRKASLPPRYNLPLRIKRAKCPPKKLNKRFDGNLRPVNTKLPELFSF